MFRSAVSLVRVDAAVSDAGGQIIPGLKKEDFRVSDEGKEQSIVNFSFEREPLDVILLFDIGGNMHSKLHELLRAVELGFHELRPGDRAAVMAFSGFTSELAPFSANFDSVNQTILLGLLNQHFGGPSKLAQAADDAALRFRREPNTQRRRAILVIIPANGDKPASRQSEEPAAVRDLWQSDAVLSELILDRSVPAVDSLVEKSGGTALATGADPGAAFQESLRRLRRRYTLYYALPDGPSGQLRSIHVELSADAARRFPGARIAARSGYLAH